MSELHRLGAIGAAKGALPAGWAQQQVDAGTSVERARDALIEAIADVKEAEHGQIRNHIRITGGADHTSPDALRNRMVAALAARVSGGKVECPAEGREFMSASLVDMAKALLEARGARDVRHASASRIVERAMGSDSITVGTGDFPLLLQGTGERVLFDSFERSRSELFRLVRQVFVSDFREIQRIRRGEMPLLEKVSELGEVKHGSTGEEGETYKIATYAKNFSLSRQAIINDDLNAFGDVLADMGRAAAATESELLLAVFVSNSLAGPIMADGLNWFAAGHNNLMTSGSDLDVASLGEARRVLRRQKMVTDAITPLNARMTFLVVPAALESDALQVLNSETDVNNAANPVRGIAQVLVDARLDDFTTTGWWAFADPALFPTLELAFLDGSRRGASANGAPILRTFEGQNVLGTVFQVIHDVGVGVVGYRGAVRATGAA